jgi:hypothetical protein
MQLDEQLIDITYDVTIKLGIPQRQNIRGSVVFYRSVFKHIIGIQVR